MKTPFSAWLFAKTSVAELSETVKDSQVHPQTSVLAFIRLPVVNARKQNRPTRTAKEIEKIITRPGIGISCLAYRVPISRFSWPLLAPRDILGGLQTGFSLPARRPGQYAYRHLRSKRANDSRPERALPQTRRSEPDPLFPFLLRPEYGVVCTRQGFRWVRLVE